MHDAMHEVGNIEMLSGELSCVITGLFLRFIPGGYRIIRVFKSGCPVIVIRVVGFHESDSETVGCSGACEH